MSLDLNDAAMSGNVEEVIIRLNMGEDPNQKFYPRSIHSLLKSQRTFSKITLRMFIDSPHHFMMQVYPVEAPAALVGG